MVQKLGPSEKGARQSVEDGKGRHELVRELQARWRPYVILRRSSGLIGESIVSQLGRNMEVNVRTVAGWLLVCADGCGGVLEVGREGTNRRGTRRARWNTREPVP